VHLNQRRCESSLSVLLGLHDPVEKPVGLCRIEGGSPVAGKEISDPEFIPGVGIFRVDLGGLPKGFDGVVVRLSLA
jgi:hypothetical protein